MWRVGLREADGATSEVEARFVISAVGSLNLPRLPEIPARLPSRTVLPLGALADDLDVHGPGSRSWAPAPAGFRSDPPSQTMSNSSHLPAHRTVDPAEPALPHHRAGRGCLGAPALPSTDGGTGSS